MKREKFDDNMKFVHTKDSSVGLYNFEVDDIYHSSYGAKKEAIEKFLTPINFKKNYFKKNKIKILDICFGIGYNTKAFLNEIINLNYRGEVHIDALEYDKKLVLLSPFIKDGFYNGVPNYILMNLLKYELLGEIIENKNLIQNILSDSSNFSYFSPYLINEAKKYAYFRGNYDPENQFNRFLHNIYYQCVSTRYKKPLKSSVLSKITLKAHYQDARKTLQTLAGSYDIIFLDAFTPLKLPTLWSLEIFKELYRLTSEDALIVTYSNSAAVRNAVRLAGFTVGKTFAKLNETRGVNKPCGTICSKNSELIENPLDEYDLGLLETNAGVYFSDPNLNAPPEEILKEREERKNSLKLESSSGYIKRNAKERQIYV